MATKPSRDDDEATATSAASRLFDVRTIIGGLFVVYGVMLVVAGLVTSDAELAKADGLNMNLWLGAGMLVLGLLFLLWMRLAPLRREEADPGRHGRRARTGGPRGG